MEYLASHIKIIGSLVYRVRAALNNNPDFISGAKSYYFDCFTGDRFNLWHYPGTANEISASLIDMNKSPESYQVKFPGILNFQPVEQRFTNEEVTYSYNLGIVAPVKSSWTTEEREKYVFDPILRPIYKELLNQITKIGKNNFFRVDFGMLPHRMYEVYTTGNNMNELIKGRYGDFIDAIEIHDLQLKIKKLCRADLEVIENENKLIE